MKTILRIICLAVVYALIFARPVDIVTAEKVAARLFPDKTPVSISSVTEHIYLTVFEPGGFVLTSADDAFPPVLAYSENAPTDRQHPSFIEKCGAYNRQIAGNISSSRPRHADWDTYLNPSFQKPSITSEVLPLVTSKWNQSPYYNDVFPYFVLPGHTDQKAYAGCVAVVMGQLLRYYEHPQRGVGRGWFYSYTTDSLLSAWFDTTYYDWENMPDSLCNSSNVLTAYPDQVADVSNLLYQCAVGVSMEMQPDGSSSSYENMMYAMISYFDYHPDMILYDAADYSAPEWNNLMKLELDNARPVPYRGQGESGGHAYLLDGYRVTTDTYFHLNWGWGGSYDGYYLLSALTPADGYDFNELQAAVLHIRPNDDNITRFAHSGFEGWQAQWIYDGGGFFSENGSYDMVRTGNYAYGFDTLDQWLITPKIHIPDNDNAELAVWAHMLNSNRECTVLLSTTDTNRGSFTVELGSIAPANSNWAEYVYSLRTYKNQDVHIAFHYDQDWGYITLDDLTMSVPKSPIGVQEIIPGSFAVLHAYPNPFNPETLIGYDLVKQGEIEITLFDLRGKKLGTLVKGIHEAGSYVVPWNAKDYSSGIYVCTLMIDGSLQATQKLVLVK